MDAIFLEIGRRAEDGLTREATLWRAPGGGRCGRGDRGPPGGAWPQHHTPLTRRRGRFGISRGRSQGDANLGVSRVGEGETGETRVQGQGSAAVASPKAKYPARRRARQSQRREERVVALAQV